MSTIETMFQSHPRPVGTDGKLAAACVRACFECLPTCVTCADACLAENDANLRQCIRLDVDCADVCDVTGRLVARPGHTDAPMLRAQLEACARACRACADECAKHGDHMEHCRVCAEVCRRCATACEQMSKAIVP